MEIEIRGMSKTFGGLRALEQVSLTARSGDVAAVIGPNGSGKSTLLDCITGFTIPDTGEVAIDGTAQRQITPRRLIEVGITRTFQNIRLWDHLSAREHVALARMNYAASRRAGREARREDIAAAALLLLERVGLGHKAQARPAELSYGERRRLEIARALATNPRLILLDEPAAGFTLSEQAALAKLIEEIAANDIAIILVEHHMDLVARVSTWVTVLNFGRVLTTGTIAEVTNDPDVISAYLGVTT